MALVQPNWNPDRRQLRWFGLACLIVFGGLGTYVLLAGRVFGVELPQSTARAAGAVLWALAVACAVLSVAAPKLLRPLYVGLNVIALPIGWVISHVVLAVVFYGMITAFALVFRLIGRDALRRKFDPDAETYWTPRKGAPDAKRYFRQF